MPKVAPLRGPRRKYAGYQNRAMWEGTLLIQKIVKVENVGRFTKLASTGNVTFEKVTLFYGENAHGKTTVAGILRSLATGDAAYLAERATIGATASQLVEVLLGTNDMARFTKGAWTKRA